MGDIGPSQVASPATGRRKIEWAGVGSRDTPEPVLAVMSAIGKWLSERGHRLRSGGARGADRAFEQGARVTALKPTIYKKDDARRDAIAHAKLYHPMWSACTRFAKKLHGRNSMIVLGPELDNPVDFIVCWTVDGHDTGGTGQALRIAADERFNIPVFNLYYPDALERLVEYVEGLENAHAK